MGQLALKRALASRPSGQWSDDDYDVLADGVVVGRIFNAKAAPVGQSWMWTLLFEHHKNRTPTHGYAATREAVMSSQRPVYKLVPDTHSRVSCISHTRDSCPKTRSPAEAGLRTSRKVQ